MKGALIKLSKETGYNFNFNGVYYKAKKCNVGLCEIESYDNTQLETMYNFIEL